MVRTPDLISAFYAPSQPPEDAAEMRRFVFDELQKIAAAIQIVAAGRVEKTYAAPAKPRDGMVRLADGTSWKPNGTGGAGVWCYYNNTWNFLG